MLPKKIKKRLISLGFSDFAIKVYAAALSIPRGEARSYKWIAQRIGRPKAVRAVGRALNKNPMPGIVPCHRVIRSDGAIGGYSGGVALKKILLKKEEKMSRFAICLIGICLIGIYLFGFLTSPVFASVNVVWQGPSDRKVIALTFDDGPKPEYAAQILYILHKEGVRATFFVVGEEAEDNLDVLWQMHDFGHEVANHSYTHRTLSRLSRREIAEELINTNNVIKKATKSDVKYMRPPGGAMNKTVQEEAGKLGLTVICWTINASDYIQEYSTYQVPDNYDVLGEDLVKKIVKEAKPGAIVLLHHGSGQTIVALPEIIKELRAMGYGFVTVRELLEGGS